MQGNQDLYDAYREEQFAADESFQQWILQPDEHNDLFWQSWLLAHPAKREIIEKATILVKELSSNDYEVQPLTALEKTSIRDRIFHNLELPASIPLSSRRIRRIPWAAVASLLTVSVTAWLIFRPKPSAYNTPQGDGSLAITTGPGETKRITLDDSTIVILNAGSTLQYRKAAHNNARETWLTGNAYFQVKKDHRLTPFLIHARSLTITVLGTELNVNARTPAAAVELTSGRIKVQQKDSNAPATYLLPGNKLSLDTATHTLVNSSIDTGLYTAWTEGKWKFHRTALEDITRLLEEYYGIDVQFRNEKSRRLHIDAIMPVSSLEDLITVIGHTLRIKITLIDRQLIVN